MLNYFIFDIDGTLVDTEKTAVISLTDTVEQLTGRKMSYEEGLRYFGLPSMKVGGLLGYDGPADFLAEWERNFVRLSHYMKVFDGVEEVLTELKAAGKHLACVTSRNRHEFGRDVHFAKLIHLFDCSICAEDTVMHKPDAEPLIKCFELLGNPPIEECIYVGDMINDCICAHNAGCTFALADWRGRGLQGIDADFHLTNTKDILDLLQR